MAASIDFNKILGNISDEGVLALEQAMIRIPSSSFQEHDLADYLANHMSDLGLEVEMMDVVNHDEPGIKSRQPIGRLKGTGGGPSLMLNGHTDINSLTRRWRRDPWTPVVEGDRLYGHGVQNMKGGLASIIMAAEAVRTSGIRLKGDLVVACVVGETQGGEGTNFLMASGFRTDMAVVAEPFGASNLVTVHSGIVHMAIHTYGVTGHVRQLEGTINAVVKMTAIITALQRVEFTYQPREDLPDLPKLNVGSVIGGLGQDYILVEPPYIPDMCTIIVDVHFLPGQTVDGIVADIRRVLDPLQAEDPELSYEIEIPPPEFFKGRRRLVMDPLDVPRDAEIVQAVARSHKDVTGQPPKAIGTVLPYSYTANDTCHLWNAGIPCLLYGPAVIRGSGGEDDSCVIISEMVQCTKVLALTALDVCQSEPL